MVRYQNAAGRVVTRTRPDPWLDASKRWNRVEPLSPVPATERATDYNVGQYEPSFIPMPDRAPEFPEAEEAPDQDDENADDTSEEE